MYIAMDSSTTDIKIGERAGKRQSMNRSSNKGKLQLQALKHHKISSSVIILGSICVIYILSSFFARSSPETIVFFQQIQLQPGSSTNLSFTSPKRKYDSPLLEYELVLSSEEIANEKDFLNELKRVESQANTLRRNEKKKEYRLNGKESNMDIWFQGQDKEIQEDTTTESMSTTNTSTVSNSTENQNLLLVPAKFHLITTFFRGQYSELRINELLYTLVKNLNQTNIERVHVLYEEDSPEPFIQNAGLTSFQLRKLHAIKAEKQPTYQALFEFANRNCPLKTPIIIANADIYFDDSLSKVRIDEKAYAEVREEKRKPIVYALSRLNAPSSICKPSKGHRMCHAYIGSHDSFIMMTPIPRFISENSAHSQNILGSENRILKLMNKAGMYIRNPCVALRSYHLHCTNERHITDTRMFVTTGRKGHVRPDRTLHDLLPLY